MHDRRVPLAPLGGELLEPILCRLLRRGRVDRFEGTDDRVAVLPPGVAEAVADQVDDALLDHRLLPSRVDRLRETLQPVTDRDEHVLDAPVLQLGEHLQPEPRTLLTITGPDAEDVAFPVHGDAHHDIERGESCRV